MKGGKLLAEGGYGCVFLPGMDCNGNLLTTQKYVSKIQRFDNSARNEIEIGKLIKKISNYGDYFSPIIKYCSIDVASIKDEDAHKCTVLKKKKTQDFVTMKILYIKGVDFIDYIMEHVNSIQILGNLIDSYQYLLKAISLLINKKIIHYDLKGTNILLATTKQIPIIIDFGLSIQVSKINNNNLKDFFYVYAPEYYVWPLEVHYMSLIANKTKNPSKNMLKELASEYVKNNKGLTKNYSSDFLKKFEKKCYTQLIYYNDLPYEERLEKLVNYWSTFDNYSLSIMYLKFLSYINIGGYSNNSFVIFFSQLCLQNIDPNPENRLTIAETIQTFKAFLHNKNINNIITFEDLIEGFVNKREKISEELVLDSKEISTLHKNIMKLKKKIK